MAYDSGAEQDVLFPGAGTDVMHRQRRSRDTLPVGRDADMQDPATEIPRQDVAG